MAPLSQNLAGVKLQHDSYGNHLDESGKIADLKLENFFESCRSFIWHLVNHLVIDGHPVDSQALSQDH